MGSFITLDTQELFDGDLRVRESGGGEIALFKLGKSLGVKLGLELFQDVCEFCVIELKLARAGYSYDHQTQKRNKVVRAKEKGTH